MNAQVGLHVSISFLSSFLHSQFLSLICFSGNYLNICLSYPIKLTDLTLGRRNDNRLSVIIERVEEVRNDAGK